MAEVEQGWTEDAAAEGGEDQKQQIGVVADDADAGADIKVFQRWDCDEVEIKDISLNDYIAVKDNSAVFCPHTAGRYAKVQFRKARCPIVERLVNALMMR